MPFFTKRPVVVEAVQFTLANREAVTRLLGLALVSMDNHSVIIRTMKGCLYVNLGDWIVKSGKGGLTVRSSADFAIKYMPVEPGADAPPDKR